MHTNKHKQLVCFFRLLAPCLLAHKQDQDPWIKIQVSRGGSEGRVDMAGHLRRQCMQYSSVPGTVSYLEFD